MSAPHISHVEWLVTDLTRSVTFLHGLFGWQFHYHSTHYRLYTPDNQQAAAVGLLQVATVEPSTGVMVHVQIPDLEQSIATALQLGAKLITAPTHVAGHGRYAQVSDPDGHLIGLFEKAASR